MRTSKSITSQTAIGKIILIGEHAVVYSQSAIALPFSKVNMRVSVFEQPTAHSISTNFYNGWLYQAPSTLNFIKITLETIFDMLQITDTYLHIDINSTIPAQRGMGSSAAVAIALIKSIYRHFNKPLSERTLLTLAHQSEQLVHGNPSGLDTTIIATQKAIHFKKGEPLQVLDDTLDAYLIVADTGITGETKEAVEKVQQLKQNNPHLHNELITTLGHLSELSLIAFQQNNSAKLGKHLTFAHNQLIQLGVSHPASNHLVNTALSHNALGAKMTGGGLGGCILALSDSNEQAHTIAEALLKNGATTVYVQPLHASN